MNKLLAYAFKGSTFVFGNLGYPADPNAHLPFLDPGSSQLGFIFAFQVLPTIIFVSAFFALLYHLGVMQIIIKAMAWVMNRLMGVSGASLSTSQHPSLWARQKRLSPFGLCSLNARARSS